MPNASLRSCAPRCRASARRCPSRSCISCKCCARKICSSRPALPRRSIGRRRWPSSTWRRSIRRPSPTRSACCSSIRTISRASRAARRRSCSTRYARSCARQSDAMEIASLPGGGALPRPLRGRAGEGVATNANVEMIESVPPTRRPSAVDFPRKGGGEERAEGRLAENIVYFARALRAAGIPVGPGAVLDALAAVQAAGVGTREDFYWTLHAVFVKRHEHSILFDQAFRVFFRRRGFLDKLLASLLPQAPPAAPPAPKPGAQRIEEALFSGLRQSEPQAPKREVDARLTMSDRELLQRKDFAQMTAA